MIYVTALSTSFVRPMSRKAANMVGRAEIVAGAGGIGGRSG